jgi:hypothetical protein
MDRPQLGYLIRRLAPSLTKRGRIVVLDGRHLRHIDYRAVRPLIEWNRQLGTFGQRLTLYCWSDYLKAILCVEDWQGELHPGPVRPVSWPVSAVLEPGPSS